MNKKFLFARLLLLCTGSLIIANSALAACIRTDNNVYLSAAALAAGYTATTWAGACSGCNGSMGLPSTISVSSSNFIANGALLASGTNTIISGGSSTPYTAKQILFRCNVADIGSLYEFYSTNGDNPSLGGATVSDITDAYYAYFINIAVRLTNTRTGQRYSRYWKSRLLAPADLYSDGTYVYVPAAAFSGITTEVFKTGSTTYGVAYGNRSIFSGIDPSGYLAFKGPGLGVDALVNGADSASVFPGFPIYWPAAWSMYNKVTFVKGATCAINTYTANVTLPTILKRQLDAGNTSTKPFTVTLRCETTAPSGTAVNATTPNLAMGFLVNNATALSAATTLGLKNASGGISYLLDNKYGTPGVASGVGIRIYNRNNVPINLLSQNVTGTGNAAGWYGYQTLATLTSTNAGINNYTGNFTASLEKISGRTVTVGSVNAQLQILVSLQ